MIVKLVFIISLLFGTSLLSNEVQIIELHSNKSLDQLVLESNNNNEDSNTIKELEDNENLNENEKFEENQQENQTTELTEAAVNVSEEITLIKQETIFDIDQNFLSNYLDSIQNIKSNTLQNEFIKILYDTKFDNDNYSEENVYFIIKKLYQTGEIQKAYDLVKKLDLQNVGNKNNLNFFYFIKLNYLYSSYQLAEACELKSELLEKSVILPRNLIEKTDIFCLVLDNKFSEAKLLNSLLLEKEIEADNNFQQLLNHMFLQDKNNGSVNLIDNIKFKELVFLYSAMLRINELPLDEEFIKVDPLNLSIPVILSKSTNMSTRIQAAHEAYIDRTISIDSLSALYQSVDFNSKQLNQPEKTISSLKSKELIMAYYYQLANIQIFPDDRLNVILRYWKFANQTGLEKIAYAVSEKIIETFSISAENSNFAMQIALANISNNNYEAALKWINLYEVSNDDIENVSYAKFLINLNQSKDLNTIINYLSNADSNFDQIKNQASQESFFVLKKFLEIKEQNNQNLLYTDFLDKRLMPSFFLMRDIKLSANNNNNELSLFLLSLISIDDRSWTELHPQHLNLVLESMNTYKNGALIKQIIIEILNELKIF